MDSKRFSAGAFWPAAQAHVERLRREMTISSLISAMVLMVWICLGYIVTDTIWVMVVVVAIRVMVGVMIILVAVIIGLLDVRLDDRLGVYTLLDVLPPDHPIIRVMQTVVMFSAGTTFSGARQADALRWLRERTGGVAAPVVAHALSNLLILVLERSFYG